MNDNQKRNRKQTKRGILRGNRFVRKGTAAVLCFAMLLTGGCGKKEEETTASVEIAPVTEAATTAPTELTEMNLSVGESSMISDPLDVTFIKDGQVLNPLTGRWIDEKYANMRPVAVQIENTKMAIPQYGLSHADIIYEMYVEGGITRLMPIFTEYDKVEKFEPIRSNRHYYDRKAVEYDAIHVFCGASDYANHNDLYGGHYPYLNFVDLIRDPGLNRDTTRYAPHNAYTLPEQVSSQIDAKGYSRTHQSYYTTNHKFKEQFEEIEGDVAEVVHVPFYNNDPWFEYDEEDQVYYRFQFNDEHIDYENGYQLWCTNILVQIVHYSNLAGYEAAGSQDVDWRGSGEGYYCTGGKVIPVTWRYNNYSTKWYTSDGEELKMNPGKTWISVYKDTNKEGIEFTEKKKEN